MKNDFTTKRVNTTEHFRRYSEAEIEQLLADDLKRRARTGDGAVAHKVIITSRDQTGTAGREYVAEVTLMVDHDPKPVDAAASTPEDNRPLNCRNRLAGNGEPHPPKYCDACESWKTRRICPHDLR